MFRRSVLPIMVLFVVIISIFQCQLPQNPADPSNTRIELLLRNSLWTQSNLSITDTIGKPIQIGLVINLPENIDSIRLSVTAEGKALFDTLLQTFSSSYKDTIWKAVSFADTGYKLVSIVPYSKVVTLVPASAGITIVKKTSTTQPGNNPPKWTEKILNVALNDTARYELNLSPMCSDPDKDALHYAISGKAFPGDTIIDSLYKFQASAATIGKNSVELIASDPSGLKDTMELVLNVTASGTDDSPPEVTIIAPDRDSSVINAGHYVVDMLCSDASGIDSVYAVFNGKTTSAVLENGHYKIAITGLVVGIYNVIELTVRDKSINALKTTKTIKIKYAQGFTITYDGNGNSSGAVPIDTGKYETGTTATVKGNTGNLVKTGYVFAGWNTAADGSGIAYADGASLIMGTKDVTLFAHWTQNATFTVTYDGNGSTAGAVPIDLGKYEKGAQVTVKSNTGNLVKTGFTFVGWATSASGTEVYKAEETFKIGTNDLILYAIWKQNTTYALTITSTNGKVTISPDATVFDSGTVVTLTPVPSTGYHFTGWSGALSGTTNPATITMNSAKSVTAIFEANPPNTFALTVLGPNGTVQKTPDQTQYDSGTVVKLTAVPDAGYQFTGWSGGITGTTNPSSVTMNEAKTVTANFVIKSFTLSVTATNGSVTKLPDADSFDSGTVVTLTAVPAAGYQFIGWDGDLTGTTNPTTVKMNAAKSVTAKFAIKTYALSVTATNGSVTRSPDADKYDSGTVVKLTAVPDVGYQFTGWSGGITGTTNPSSVTMNAAKNITASFSLKTFALSITATNGSVTKSPNANTYDSGTVVMLTAVPAAGYQFTGWSGGLTGTTNPTSITMGAAKSVTANFTLKKFTLTITSSNGSITKSPDANSYDSGTAVLLTAVPDDGYVFSNWSGGLTGTTSPSSITMNSAKTVTANFIMARKVTYDANGGGLVGGHGTGIVPVDRNTYANGDAVNVLGNTGSLTRKGYFWGGWSTTIDGDSVAQILMGSEDITLYARWVIRDASGNTYKEVRIGNQVWMATNLRTTKLNNGNELPRLSSEPVASYVECDTRALYNGYCVMSDTIGLMAPDGWRVASTSDWGNLYSNVQYDAKSLASKDNWYESTVPGTAGYEPSTNNESGFNAYPDGGRASNGDFLALGYSALFWVYGGTYWGECYGIPNNDPAHSFDKMELSNFYSIRCIREY